MNYYDDCQKVSGVALQKFKFALEGRISQEMIQNCQAEVYIDYMTKDMVGKITRDVLGQKMDVIMYPENWKEAVKEAFFNWIKPVKWLSFISKKHHVKYKVYDAVMYYPTMAMPEREHVFKFTERS